MLTGLSRKLNAVMPFAAFSVKLHPAGSEHVVIETGKFCADCSAPVRSVRALGHSVSTIVVPSSRSFNNIIIEMAAVLPILLFHPRITSYRLFCCIGLLPVKDPLERIKMTRGWPLNRRRRPLCSITLFAGSSVAAYRTIRY